MRSQWSRFSSFNLGTIVCLVSCAIYFLLTPGEVSAQIINFPATGAWNGNFKQANIVECGNGSTKRLSFRLRVVGNLGEQKGIVNVALAPHQTKHIILNQFDIENQLGTYILEPRGGGDFSLLTCHTVFYKMSPADSISAVDYAYGIPLLNPLQAKTAGVFNSADPDNQGRRVYNWLSVINPGTTNFSAEIRIYDHFGKRQKNRSIRINNLPPGQRKDFPLHNFGEETGQFQILPTAADLPYLAFVVRYLEQSPGVFSFAFPLIPQKGSCNLPPISASTAGDADNWGEVFNTSSRQVTAKIRVRNRFGKTVFQGERLIKPFAQAHFPLHEYLGANNVGSFEVTCKNGALDGARLVAQSLFYGRNSRTGNTVSWAYASQPLTPAKAGDTLLLPVNTHLSQANWLKLTNLTNIVGRTDRALYDQAGQLVHSTRITLGPRSSLDQDIHSRTGYDFIGLAALNVRSASLRHTAELIRVFPGPNGIEYVMNIPARVIGAAASPPLPPTSASSSSASSQSSSSSSSSSASSGGNSCGNNVLEGSEACECGVDRVCGNSDDILNGAACTSLGATGGTLTCTSSCSLNTAQCVFSESVYYVDGNLSSDCNGTYSIASRNCSGSDGSAYKSFHAGVGVLVPGDTLLVRGGVYREALLLDVNGLPNKRILVKNYPGEIPIIDGENVRAYPVTIGRNDPRWAFGHYLTFDGFTVKNPRGISFGQRENGTAISVLGTEGVIIRNCKVFRDDYPGHNNPFVLVPWDYIAMGIMINGHNVDTIVENCTVHHLWGGIGARINGGDLGGAPIRPVFRWNHVFFINVDSDKEFMQNYSSPMGFSVLANSGIAEHNLIHHGLDNGIGTNGSAGHTIANNIVYLIDPTDTGGNGPGIKTKPVDGPAYDVPGKDRVHHNLAFLTRGGFEINLASFGKGAEVYNNLAYGNFGKGITVSQFTDPNLAALVVNNISFGNTDNDIKYATFPAGFNDFNIAEDAGFSLPSSPHNLSGDPGVANLALLTIDNNQDGSPDLLDPLNDPNAFPDARSAILYAREQVAKIFSLTPNSKAVDAGIDLGKGDTDLIGNTPRDIVDKTPWPGLAGANVVDMGPLEYVPALYVDGNGGDGLQSGCSDNGSGTLSEPFCTIQKAANVVTAGDTVLVRGGTYNENFTVLRSGTAANRITFKNYGTERPILDQQNVRGHCIIIGHSSNGPGNYVTIEGFTCKNIGRTGVVTSIAVYGSKDTIIRNNLVYRDDFPGALQGAQIPVPLAANSIVISGPATNALVEYNTVFNTYGIRTILASGWGAPSNPIIRWNHVHHTNMLTDDDHAQNNSQGISISNSTANALVENNLIHHVDDNSVAIDRTAGHMIRYNIMYLAGSYPASVGSGSAYRNRPAGFVAGKPDIVAYNIGFLNRSGFKTSIVQSSDQASIQFFNNISYKSREKGMAIAEGPNPPAPSMAKGNIVFGSDGAGVGFTDLEVADSITDPNQSDYNFIGDKAKYPTRYLNSDFHSITGVDPQLMNLALLDVDNNGNGTPDVLDPLNDPNAFPTTELAIRYAKQKMVEIFGLQPTSPLIDKGISSGLGINDFSGKPVSGSAPDIGSFENVP